jgi:transcription antitermination factor NusG
MTDPIDWTLVTVAPNTDRKVKAALEQHAFQHHMFRHRETIMRYGRRMPVLKYTFPRYCFVPLEDCWNVTARIDHVWGPIRFGETVAPCLPPGLVESLVASCTGEDILPAIAKAAGFIPGTP